MITVISRWKIWLIYPKKHFGDKYDLKYFIIETFEDSYVEYDNQAILLGNYFIITLKD